MDWLNDEEYDANRSQMEIDGLDPECLSFSQRYELINETIPDLIQSNKRLIAAVRFARSEMLGAAHASTHHDYKEVALKWIEGRMYASLAKLQSGELGNGE